MHDNDAPKDLCEASAVKAAGQMQVMNSLQQKYLRQIVYLACPYKHTDSAIMETRFLHATIAAARLMKIGFNIFSPITHNHTIAKMANLPETWDYWCAIDMDYLRKCVALFVLNEHGWKESVGVQAEIKYMRSLRRPIYLVDKTGTILEAL